MKKIILLLGLVFLLSGCTVEYRATFTNDTVQELIYTYGANYSTIPITAYITDQGASEEDIKITGIEYYDFINNGTTKTFKYDFPFANYSFSTAINTCLKKITINETTDNNYLLNTSNYFSCMDLYPTLTNILVNLTFSANDFTVISSNADSVQDITYTWNINKENYQNKNIQVMFKKIKEEDSQKEPTKTPDEGNKVEGKKNDSFLIIILSFLSLGVLIGIICFLKSQRL